MSNKLVNLKKQVFIEFTENGLYVPSGELKTVE